MKEDFYKADRETYKKVAPIIKKLFNQYSATTTIEETEDGDRVDIYMTANTKYNDSYYVMEVKNREGRYTFSKFWDAEEGYLSKEEYDLTKEESTLGKGQLIKEKKIKALIQRAGESRKAMYVVNFPDNVMAFWTIDASTKYGEIDLFYDKYNVEKGEKEMQHNYTLMLHDATFIYHYE